MIETSRRGFLQGLLAVSVISALPSRVGAIGFSELVPPDGWTYQWVCSALLGDPTPENIQKRLDNGWTFVPPSRHGSVPSKELGKALDECGLVLMEKPTHLIESSKRLATHKLPKVGIGNLEDVEQHESFVVKCYDPKRS